MAKPRVKKLLELKSDTPEFLEALDALASIQAESGSRQEDAFRRDARRHLRFDLEDRSLRLIEAFISEGERVHETIRSVRVAVSDLERETTKALGDLESAENATTRFVEESSSLREARREAEQRAETVAAFLQRFQLTEKEQQSLQKQVPDMDFFNALTRVRKIRDECSELLSGAHQSAGLEIFEQMAAYQNQAQDVVYAWMKQECADGTAARELETESKRALFSKAFAEFKHSSPAYYSHGIELISKARRVEVSKKFSILVHEKHQDHMVTDPVRSLSDLLTSLHEVCAEERDLYQNLFHTAVGVSAYRSFVDMSEDPSLVLDNNGGSVTPLSSNLPGGTKTGKSTLDPTEQQECLESALAGLSPTLKARVSNCIEGIQDSVASFRAVQVLDFYLDTLHAFFPLESTNSEEDNPLIVVRSLKEEASWKFFHLVEAKASELQMSARTRALPGSDLSASFEVLELVRCLRDVLASIRDHSLVQRKQQNASLEETTKALKAFVVPIRNLIHSADQTFSNQADACVFAVNNLAALQGVLTLHEFTAELVEELTFEIGERVDLLARIRADHALHKVGLVQLLTSLDKVDSKSQIFNEPGLRVEQVKVVFDAFYKDLSGSLVMPEFDRIDAPRLRHQARSATCSIILNSHNRMYDAVENGGYSDTSFLVYTKDQVADLLDV